LKFKSTGKLNVNLAPYYVDWNHKVSAPQKLVKDFLKPFWKSDCVLEEFRIPKTLLRLDLFNVSRHIVVEISPEQHQEFNEFFHKTRAGFLSSLKRDMEKRAWAENEGFTFVEIYADDMEKLSKEWFAENGVNL